jgi:hypothetical protein
MAAIMELARGAGDIVTTAQAVKVGIDRKQLQRLVSKGALVREARGVYRLAGAPLGIRERALAATYRIAGVVSHETAAQLWGHFGAGFDGTVIHLTVSRSFHPVQRPGVIVHTTRRPLDGLTTTRAGVTVTRPLRTVLDVSAHCLDDQQLQGFLNFCVSEHLVTIRSLERYVSSKGRGVRGLTRLRRLVAGSCELDSLAEAQLVSVLAVAGVEPPVTQFAVRDERGFVGRVDLAWPDCRVALELDGYRYHSDARTFVTDRERGNRIVAAGWALLRTTPRSVREAPHLVVSDVKAALTRSGAA